MAHKPFLNEEAMKGMINCRVVENIARNTVD